MKLTQEIRSGMCLLLAVLLAAGMYGCGQTAPEQPSEPAAADYIVDVTPLQPQLETTAPTEPDIAAATETTPEETTPETTAPAEDTESTQSSAPEETTEPAEISVSTQATEPTETAAPTQITEPTEASAPTQTTEPAPTEVTPPPTEVSVQEQVAQAVQNEAVSLPADAAIPDISTAVASGVLVKSNEEAIIDYSNTSDGYVMVKYTASTQQRLKAQVKGPSTTYTFNLTPGQWAAFPLSDENGTYQITVYKNVVDSKYAAVLSLTTEVTMTDEFAPFLCSNQFVNFDAAPSTVSTAASLCSGADSLGKVTNVYNFVVKGMTYDVALASTVQSGYVPDLDSVLAKMSGICFDYAALMTGMLRSQGVPCKLVVGYAGDVYHAWINVWSESTGWVEGIVFFDGTSWQRMDPTFASSSGSSPDILSYIGDGTNYSAKYVY